MGSLTDISIASRKFIIIGAVMLALLIVFRLAIGAAFFYWKLTHPIPPPEPDVRFGKLISPKFSNVVRSSSGINFILENIEGKPPATTDSGKVYYLPKKQPTFLSSEKANNLAGKIGFTSPPVQLGPINYLYTDPKDPLRSLVMDIVYLSFEMKYNYSGDPDSIFSKVKIPSRENAVREVKEYLSKYSLIDSALINGVVLDRLLIFDGELRQFVKTEKESLANALRVDFFHPKLDGMFVLPPKYFESYNYAVYVPGSEIQYLEISSKFWPIDYSNFATYPLRSSGQAWQDLVDGYGYVANMGSNSPEKVIIRNIFLAYYDDPQSQAYLQPVFVFSGDNDFIAYLPALSPEWLEQ